MTTFTKHAWPGLDTPVYLPDWITVEVKLIPAKLNWGRYGRSTSQVKTTWHDTGNPRTNADGEYAWAANGRPGGSGGNYNGIFDGAKLIITAPFNEIIGATATPTGNRTSYSLEQALNGPGGFEGSLVVGCWVHAAVCVAKGWEVDTALVQHRYWSGKWCPGQILNKNRWSQVVNLTTQRAKEIRDYLRGEQAPEVPAPGPKYALPSIVAELDTISKSDVIAPGRVEASGATWVWVGDRVMATRKTGRYGRANPNAERVGPDLNPGEEFNVDWITQYEGAWWYYTPYGTRILVDDTERISDVKGEEA